MTEKLGTFFEKAANGFISSSYIFLYLDSSSELKPLPRSSAYWEWENNISEEKEIEADCEINNKIIQVTFFDPLEITLSEL